MRYLVCPDHNPAFHLALEEHLLGQAGAYFFFWRSAPCVVIGRNQNAFLEVDTRCAELCDIPILRRCSGGGAVYHDLGNINFSVIQDLEPGKLVEYDTFLEPMVQALCRLNLPVRRRNKSDLFLGEGKISGNAQSMRRGRVLHHGTLLFDSDLSALERLLFLPEHGAQSKGTRSNRSPVVNLRGFLHPPMDAEAFQAALLGVLFPGGLSRYRLTAEDIAAVQKRMADRYTRWSWNYGRSPELKVEADAPDKPSFSVEKGRITRLHCPALPDEICAGLVGLKYSYRLLKESLCAHPALSNWSEKERVKLADSFFAGGSR